VIFAFAAGGGGFYTPTPMARRHARSDDEWQPRPRRRRGVFAAAALAVLAAAAWFAPALIVLTDLRDRPLEAIFAGIDGRVTSRAAEWQWWGTIEYRDVVLRDPQGRPLVAVPRVVIGRGLASLLVNPGDLGAVRLIGGEALVEVRRGGSTIEDVLAPWLAAVAQATAVPASFELEVVDAAVELVDLERNDAWRITDLLAAGTVRPDATLAGWTISGRARHSGTPLRDLDAAANRVASDRVQDSAGPAAAGQTSGGMDHTDQSKIPARADASGRLDRTTVAAGATAILAREGGWSVSSPDSQPTAQMRTLAVAATRLPLGISSVLATRFDAAHVLDGLADVRLDITLPPPHDATTAAADGPPRKRTARPTAETVRVAGVVSGSQLAICQADTLAELITLDRGEMPIDLSVDGDRITVRSLKVNSQLFRAEASGRIRLPAGGTWDWAEALAAENFAVAADIDLAAAARAMPGGLTVRPDVRVTGGQLQITAVARADGNERVLEVRASSRDLAAVQSVVATQQDASGVGGGPRGGGKREERLLRWNEPFTAWLRGRRGATRGDRLRIEEARISSPAVEVSAFGTAESSTVQWTLDFDKLVAEAGEVLELDGVQLAGTSRGRVDLERVPGTMASHAKVSASLSNFELTRPGRRPWRDAELSIEAEGSGGFAGGALLIDQGHAVVAAADDTLEVTLTGGALVNLGSVLSAGVRRDDPWLRAAPGSQSIAADCSLTGELARWQPRWEGVLPSTVLEGVELGGFAKASAALAAQGGSWQITRAGGEVEKLTVMCNGRQISEPRAVVSAAGQWNPASGQVAISSAELLTPTLSLRTGGLALLPARGNGPVRSGLGLDRLGLDHPGTDSRVTDSIVDRFRGKLQWQADVARLERWLVPAALASRWPAAGRAWGTAEILDTPIGMNVLVEATGSQLAIASTQPETRAGDAAGGKSRDSTAAVPLWSEPRATLMLEVTCPPAQTPERMTVNQLKLESSTLAVVAAGSIGELSSRRMVELGGNVAYDWEQVSRLLTPWTGGRLRLAGAGARPFTLRGPLGELVATSDAAAADARQQLLLPEDWLPSARGVQAEKVSRVAVPLPLPTTRRSSTDLSDRLRAISIDTSAAWTAAEVAGFQFAPGEMPVRFFEGQLALGPFDLAASGGRLRGAPWLRLLPAPGELVVPPGRCLDRLVVTQQLCDRWVNWLVPLIGQSTHTQGLMSVDLAGARLPLADPFGGEASGQVIFENFESTPGERVQPLVNLIAKLQTAIDPRFAFGDKAVLLRVRPEPVSVRLADRRLWHEGLVIDAGQLVIRSAGSVAADGTLAMMVEVAFRGDIMGATPVVGKLLRTPLVIPLKGTVHRPQFDARAIDVILARVMENTAEALIGPKLSRDLETLFGNPPPPEGTPTPAPAASGPPMLEFPQPTK
jgi:translocation and assembly module TamB